MTNEFEPMMSNFLDEGFYYIGGGRRKECKAKGLKGKAFRDCVKGLRKEEKGLSRSEKKEKKKERKKVYEKALLEGKVEKGKNIRKLQKFNPSAIALRGTIITALRFNIFGVATRLYPALLTEEEAKKKNFDVENLPKAKEALNKVYAFYVKIGGDPKKVLEKVIIKAHDKPIFNTKKAKARKALEEGKSSFDGEVEQYSNLAEESIVAISTASAGLLASIIAAVGAKKNPYKKGSAQYNKFDTEATQAPPVPEGYQRVIKEAEEGAAQDREKGLGLDDSDDTKENKILGMPPMLAVGVFALVAIGGFFVIRHVMKNKSTPVTA